MNVASAQKMFVFRPASDASYKVSENPARQLPTHISVERAPGRGEGWLNRDGLLVTTFVEAGVFNLGTIHGQFDAARALVRAATERGQRQVTRPVDFEGAVVNQFLVAASVSVAAGEVPRLGANEISQALDAVFFNAGNRGVKAGYPGIA